MTRRLLVPLVTFLFVISSMTATARTLTIGFVGDRTQPAYQGVQQGIKEGNLQGDFLGVTYELLDLDTAGNPVAIVAAIAPEALYDLVARYPNTAIINVTSSDNTLRASCHPNLFHTIPSQQMFMDAQSQWRKVNPKSDAKAAAWHKSFRKYAAAQLNIRFHESFNEYMNDEAWAGWAATRLLADTLIRAPDLVGNDLIDELKTNIAFDGQKGADMSFRDTGQLRQPLLLIDGGKIVGEAPVRGAVDITDLDSLGRTGCPK